jgi:hypothetical protein
MGIFAWLFGKKQRTRLGQKEEVRESVGDSDGSARIAIIIIDPQHDSPQTVAQIVAQQRDIGAGTKVTTYNGPPKFEEGVDCRN